VAVPVAVAGNARRTSSSSVRYFSRPYVTAAAYRASRAARRIDLDQAEERRHRHGLPQHVRVLPSSDLTTLCGTRLSPTHRIEAEQIQTAAAPIRSHDPTSENCRYWVAALLGLGGASWTRAVVGPLAHIGRRLGGGARRRPNSSGIYVEPR
jgi:hypothetical protein